MLVIHMLCCHGPHASSCVKSHVWLSRYFTPNGTSLDPNGISLDLINTLIAQIKASQYATTSITLLPSASVPSGAVSSPCTFSGWSAQHFTPSSSISGMLWFPLNIPALGDKYQPSPEGGTLAACSAHAMLAQEFTLLKQQLSPCCLAPSFLSTMSVTMQEGMSHPTDNMDAPASMRWCWDSQTMYLHAWCYKRQARTFLLEAFEQHTTCIAAVLITCRVWIYLEG